jgi:hypothetical protein
MKRKRMTRLTPEFWARDAALKREMAERIAYLELRHGSRTSWKDSLDDETRKRVDQRADELLAELGRA